MFWRSNNKKSCSGMESDEKKKLNDDLVVFMRKSSETVAPRYTARLKTYVDFKQKRRRAAAARRNATYRHKIDCSVAKKNNDLERDKSPENSRGGEKRVTKPQKLSRSSSAEPADACRQPRRRRQRRRRVRSCRRRSRRRRSCGRRRKRSRSRRRRRCSCRRRRRQRRRCR